MGAVSAQLNPEQVKEVIRRTQQIREAGRVPEWLFCCRRGPGSLAVPGGPDNKPAVLLFTTQPDAQDYIRFTGAAEKVAALKLESLQEAAQGWISAGCGSFILNRCPRCNIAVTYRVQLALSKQDFLAAWAVDRATKSVSAERLVRSAMTLLQLKPAQGGTTPGGVVYDTERFAKARSELEALRDHITCGVPWVHQMIGLLAGIQRDEAAAAAAVERLKEFGPRFDGTTDVSPENFAKNIATAATMLTMTFVPAAHDRTGKPAVLPLFY